MKFIQTRLMVRFPKTKTLFCFCFAAFVLYEVGGMVVATQWFQKNDADYKTADSKYIPESLFPCYSKQRTCSSLDEIGKLEMNSSKIVFAGLVRNVDASQIAYVKEKFQFLGAQFMDYRIILVENDSKTNARQLLLQWVKENYRVTILGCGVNVDHCTMDLTPTFKHEKSLSRITKMAFLRNIYLDYFEQEEIFKDFQYLMVLDPDLQGSLYLDGLWNTFGHFRQDPARNIGGICPAGMTLDWYYGWSYHDPFAHYEYGETDYFWEFPGLHDAHVRFWHVNRFWTKRGQELRRVRSCFNGVAIYRRQAAVNSRYNSSTTRLTCEHVFFHDKMKMYFNPSMPYTITRWFEHIQE